ncbi:MAG: lipocalin family protein [Acidobacteria bacterium]|nr:lipocalin family protein [Acidobacteriota bacterium]
MKKSVWFVIIPTIVAVSAAAAVAVRAQKEKKDLPTVAKVDLKQYTGKWYEIARYPNRFQDQCAGNVTATYTVKSNGRIEVLNECLKKNGVTDKAKGEAKIVDKTTNAKLEVRFAPAFLSFIPAVWGDYWIIDLDPDYKYAVIGEPSRKYLWILSRTPELDDTVYQNILRRVESLGFSPGKLDKTPQKVEAVKGAVVDKQTK